jgi:hypothetical protein
MKSGLLGEPIGVPIRMSAKPVEWRFSWDHITSFGGGLQLIDYVGKFLRLAPFHTVTNYPITITRVESYNQTPHYFQLGRENLAMIQNRSAPGSIAKTVPASEISSSPEWDGLSSPLRDTGMTRAGLTGSGLPQYRHTR